MTVLSPVPTPRVVGPLPTTDQSRPFSTMWRAREPIDLDAHGYLEEEYLVHGLARTFARKDNSIVAVGDPADFCTRVLVRRPAEGGRHAWVSVLNASAGYDIEDDWRRAWDHIIAQRDVYVGVTSKPIQVAALQTFDPIRYAELSWGGAVPQIEAGPGWNPFQVIEGCEEGLVWDMLGQVAAWVRSGNAFAAPGLVFMIGQSQSAVYTNTYLTYFHDLLNLPDGTHPYDGYLPGVGSVFCKQINQTEPSGDGSLVIGAPGSGGASTAFVPVLVEPVDLDVPVITVSSQADTELFPGGPSSFVLGDGPLRRHWHVAASPHSDARSRVIPNDAEVVRAGRPPRAMDEAFLARLTAFPLEPAITAAMRAIVAWAEEGVPAAPSSYFTVRDDAFVADVDGVLAGGGAPISFVKSS